MDKNYEKSKTFCSIDCNVSHVNGNCLCPLWNDNPFRLHGSDDCIDFLPKMQYGVMISYGLFKNTGLAVEF